MMGLDFLKNHGAQRTTGADGANVFASLSDDELIDWIARYTTMNATGSNASGANLSDRDLTVIRQQLDLMKIELRGRGILAGEG